MAILVPDTSSCREQTYRGFCAADEAVHAMRYHWAARHQLGWIVRDHWHLALVEEGVARFVAKGLDEKVLEPGTCRIVPAGTPHCIEAVRPEGVVETYLVFRLDLVRDLRRQLGPDRPVTFPWSPGAPPVLVELDEAGVRDAVTCCNRLIMHPPPRHEAVEALCTALRLGTRVEPSPYADLPPWLRNAVIQLRAPNYLEEGVLALARLAGRSVDHVNRTVRASRGITATALVNDLRMEMASARLRLSGDPVVAIAKQVGLADISHFYRLFKAVHGTTPARYRRSHR